MTNHNRIVDDVRPAEFDFIVVGSGAGEATVAEALARQGRAVLVLKRGQSAEELGTTRASLRYYDVNPVAETPPTSQKGIIAWRAFMAGGSTVVLNTTMGQSVSKVTPVAFEIVNHDEGS